MSERRQNWAQLCNLNINNKVLPEEVITYLTKMYTHINYIYNDLCVISPKHGKLQLTPEMSTEQRKSLRSVKASAKKIEKYYKEIKLILGKIDVNLGVESEYAQYYKIHKHRGNYK